MVLFWAILAPKYEVPKLTAKIEHYLNIFLYLYSLVCTFLSYFFPKKTLSITVTHVYTHTSQTEKCSRCECWSQAYFYLDIRAYSLTSVEERSICLQNLRRGVTKLKSLAWMTREKLQVRHMHVYKKVNGDDIKCHYRFTC